MKRRDTKESPTVILKFRVRPERAEILQLIADAEHQGNLSELMRELTDRKIAERLRRRPNAA